jgi:transposase-like protein
MEGQEWKDFLKSIKATGGNDAPISYRMVGTEKQGLDGRNRWFACKELHIRPRLQLVVVEDAAVVQWILRRNLHRRHLSLEVRNQILEELLGNGMTVSSISRAAGVSRATVRRSAGGGKKKEPGSPPVFRGSHDPEPLNGVPKRVQNALADTWHADCARTLDRMMTQAKSAFSWSAFLDVSVVDILRSARDLFISAMPTRLCPFCQGAGVPEGAAEGMLCLTCRGAGYLASHVAG